MIRIDAEPIDLTSLRAEAAKVTSVDDTMDALATWFARVPLDEFDDARESVIQQAADHPLLHLFPRATMDTDGRKIHSVSSDRQRLGVPENVWATMMESFLLRVQILAEGYIGPGLRDLSTSRRLTIGDFEVLAGASPFVPAKLVTLYARALHHGYYDRLPEALHLLAPLTEACVRANLHRAGIETRNIRGDDTEIEPGLSALMELDGVEKALSVDLAWNIRALYCGPLGSNLRNRVAHGLLDEGEASGPSALFAWWLAFRLAFVPYYNLLHRTAEDPEATATPSP